LADCALKYAKSGDVIVCLGAGSITKWANDLPADIRKITGGRS
jgi:UDP-N-acetylmuramate--alanine ligase